MRGGMHVPSPYVRFKASLTASSSHNPDYLPSCTVLYQICRHTYGRDAIRSHIKVSKKHPASCPVAGCLQKVTNADLEPDKDMERRVSEDSINCRHQLLRYPSASDVSIIVSSLGFLPYVLVSPLHWPNTKLARGLHNRWGVYFRDGEGGGA